MGHIFSALPPQDDPRLLLDYQNHDDAGIFRIREDYALVQTIDFFTPIVDDPADFGAISAANALSDVFAMGGTPLTALSIVCFPYRQLEPDILAAICAGGAAKIRESGAVTLGGHSVEDAEVKFGYAVTGFVDPRSFWRNNTPEIGDALVLTKSLGTGLLTTAVKQEHLDSSFLQEPLASMKQLNKAAAETARGFDIHAATDVTGFGLLGHLFEMLRSRSYGAELSMQDLPCFPGVQEAIKAGALTRAHRTNMDFIADYFSEESPAFEAHKAILLDPQTSGGLLLSLAEDQANTLVDELKHRGLTAHKIGTVLGKPGFRFQ